MYYICIRVCVCVWGLVAFLKTVEKFGLRIFDLINERSERKVIYQIFENVISFYKMTRV